MERSLWGGMSACVTDWLHVKEGAGREAYPEDSSGDTCDDGWGMYRVQEGKFEFANLFLFHPLSGFLLRLQGQRLLFHLQRGSSSTSKDAHSSLVRDGTCPTRSDGEAVPA